MACSHRPRGNAGETPHSVKPAGRIEGRGSEAQQPRGDLAAALLLSPSQLKSPNKRRASTSSSDAMRTQASRAPSGRSRQQAEQELQPGECVQGLAGQQGPVPAPSTAAGAGSAQAADGTDVSKAALPGSGAGPGGPAAGDEQQQVGQCGEQPLALPNEQQPAVGSTEQGPLHCAATQIVLPTLAVALPLQPAAGVAQTLQATAQQMQALPATACVMDAASLPATAADLPATAVAGSQLPLLPPTQELVLIAVNSEQAVAQLERQQAAAPSAAATTAAESEGPADIAAVAASVAAAAVTAAVALAEAVDRDVAAQLPVEEEQQQEAAAAATGQEGGTAAAPVAPSAGAEVQAATEAPVVSVRDVEVAEAAGEPAGSQRAEAGAEPQAVEVEALPSAGQAEEVPQAAAAMPASPIAAAAAAAEGTPSAHHAAACTPQHMLAPIGGTAAPLGSGASSESQGDGDSGTGGSCSGSSSEEEDEEDGLAEPGDAVPPSPLCTADELAMARQQEREALLARHCTQSPTGAGAVGSPGASWRR